LVERERLTDRVEDFGLALAFGFAMDASLIAPIPATEWPLFSSSAQGAKGRPDYYIPLRRHETARSIRHG
jgi:hypothetical protein